MNQHYQDLNRVACLLCERLFKSVPDLEKHQLKSTLHKTNMEELKSKKILELRETLLFAKDQDKQQQYRNRAAERRTKEALKPKKIAFSFNSSSKLKNKPLFESSIEKEIGQDNVGNKLLQKMGWKAGEGLGVKMDGITAPIQLKDYKSGAGLGSK